MTELSRIKQVIIVDGYGRKYTTIHAKEIHVMTDLGTMWIRHDGDTQHSLTSDFDQLREVSQQIADESFEAQAEVVREEHRRPVSEGRGILGKDWLGGETVEEYMNRIRGGTPHD